MIEPDELSVSPLELFFDLVFVFAITQIVALIEHDLTPAGVAKGALVLAMIYWGWSLFTWTLNAEALPRTLLALGFALVLLSFVASAYRAIRRIPYARLGAALAIGIVSAAGASFSGLVVLGIDSAIVFAMLVYESWARRHPERVPGHPTEVVAP